jgi:hypothetical protein
MRDHLMRKRDLGGWIETIREVHRDTLVRLLTVASNARGVLAGEVVHVDLHLRSEHCFKLEWSG